MRKLLLALAALAMGAFGTCAQAQGPYVAPPVNAGNPYARPIFSPWLNLANRNQAGGPAANFNAGITYAGIIRPEFQYQGAINTLTQQNLSTASALQQQNAFDQQLMTGHRSVYQNLSHYYPTSRYGGAGGNASPYTMRPAASIQGYQMGGGMGGMGGGTGQTGMGAGRAPQGRQ